MEHLPLRSSLGQVLSRSHYALLNLGVTICDEVKPWSQTGSSGRSLSRFPQHESARNISTPPERDASPSQVTPRNLLGFPNNSPVPIYTPGWREAL